MVKMRLKRYFVDCGLEVEEEFSTEKADIIVGIKTIGICANSNLFHIMF